MKLKIRRIENAWRIEVPAMPKLEELDEARAKLAGVAQLAKAIQQLADRISSGDLETAEEANQALKQAFGGAQPTEDAAAADEQPRSARPNRTKERKRPTRRKAREREEVDEVISGPVLNRSGR